MESGAPDHVGNIDTAVFELGLSVLDPGDPGTRSTPRCCQVFGLTLIKGSPVDTHLGRAFFR